VRSSPRALEVNVLDEGVLNIAFMSGRKRDGCDTDVHVSARTQSKKLASVKIRWPQQDNKPDAQIQFTRHHQSSQSVL
jgi:hypothetical protein